jgi:group I intron endonuclease
MLEFCDRDVLLSRETHFISTLNPAYNIYKVAGSPLGYKHTTQSIAKIRKGALGRVFTKETLGKMSEAAKTRWLKTIQTGSNLSILDLKTNITSEYSSIAEAARRLTLSRSALTRRLSKELITTLKYKHRYIIACKTA